MNRFVFALPALINASLLFFTNTNAATQKTNVEKNIVKGRITDSKGRPMPNVKVTIENTVFYGSYVHTTTNAAGDYRVAVLNGSWKVSASIEKVFLGKTYGFDLHPDNAEPFAGTKGAIRNFTWKLSGEKPDGGGFYGSNLAVYNQPGSSFTMEEVEITLTPEGSLIDGNNYRPLISSLIDIGGGEDGIRDIPIGKYIITARKKTSSKTLKVRLRNKGVYSDSITAGFESGFTGLTTYQIVIQLQDSDDL